MINDLMATIIRLGLNFGEPRVEAVLPNGTLQEKIALSIFPPTRKTVTVLNDDDPANADQVRAIWIEEWLHASLRPILKEQADLLAQKIKNNDVLAVVSAVIGTANDVLGFFTDNVDGDAELLKQYFLELFKDEKTRDLVIDNIIMAGLKAMNAQQGLIDLIRSIALEVWNSWIGGTDLALTVADLK